MKSSWLKVVPTWVLAAVAAMLMASATPSATLGARSATIDALPMTLPRAPLLVEVRTLAAWSGDRRMRRASSRLRAAGTRIVMMMNAEMTPTAVKMPKSAMGGSGEVRLVRKPRTVVTVASTRAPPTVRTAMEAARSGDCPWRCSSRYREVRWMA